MYKKTTYFPSFSVSIISKLTSLCPTRSTYVCLPVGLFAVRLKRPLWRRRRRRRMKKNTLLSLSAQMITNETQVLLQPGNEISDVIRTVLRLPQIELPVNAAYSTGLASQLIVTGWSYLQEDKKIKRNKNQPIGKEQKSKKLYLKLRSNISSRNFRRGPKSRRK